MRPKNHVDNSIYGRGEVRFAPFDDDGNPTAGQRFIGNVPSLSITSSSEVEDLYSSWGRVSELLASVTTRVERTGDFTTTNISRENLALFIAGELDDISQSSETGKTEDIEVSPGLYYQLGVSNSQPTGVVDISDVTVEDAGGGTTYSEGDDYTVNEDLGYIFITSDSSISADTEVTVTYDVGSKSIPIVRSTDKVTLRGSLWYEAENSTGKDRNLFLPNVELSPDGDLSLITESDFLTIGFSMKILPPADGVGEAVQFYG